MNDFYQVDDSERVKDAMYRMAEALSELQSCGITIRISENPVREDTPIYLRHYRTNLAYCFEARKGTALYPGVEEFHDFKKTIRTQRARIEELETEIKYRKMVDGDEVI